jgi:hypothetical protein
MTTSFVSSPMPFLTNAPDAEHSIRNADRRAIVVQIWPTITKSSRRQVGAFQQNALGAARAPLIEITGASPVMTSVATRAPFPKFCSYRYHQLCDLIGFTESTNSFHADWDLN